MGHMVTGVRKSVFQSWAAIGRHADGLAPLAGDETSSYPNASVVQSPKLESNCETCPYNLA